MRGLVYLIAVNGDSQMFKIGVTKSTIEKRIKKLQTGNGNQLICINSFKSNNPYKLEKMLHNHFSDYRQEGEWFLFDKEQVNEFLPACEKYQNIIDSLQENPYF